MARVASLALAVLLLAACAPKALGLGADFSKANLVQGELVKGQTPVHGYFVNWEDVFFYSGDTKALNEFLAAYGKLPKAKLRVVIHAGTTRARSPWGPQDRGPADWSFYRWNTGGRGNAPAPTRVDVWLGSRIRLDELRVPGNVEVESGGEIEKFVAARKAKKP
jgi:hypothetical protein